MSLENITDTQITYLEKIHEDILYAVECLVEDYTRETRSELSDILKSEAFKNLHKPYQLHIESAITRIVDRLVMQNYDRDARSWVIKLRRQVRNTISKLQGQKQLYNYADTMEC